MNDGTVRVLIDQMRLRSLEAFKIVDRDRPSDERHGG